MTTTVQELPMLLTEIRAVAVERLSPSYVRVEFGGDELAHLGVDGPFHDQRIKLIFPNDRRELPAFTMADASWYTAWLELPDSERGHMRTYTIREVRGSGVDTTMVVDFVLHTEADGSCGPGAGWAASAAVGDRLITCAPRRGVPFGGIEFVPGTARELLLVGDETAVPAVCSILEGLPATARGAVFLEVPTADDAQAVTAPVGVRVTWLPRDGAAVGDLLHPAVRAHLGTGSPEGRIEVGDDEIDPDLWETPTWSSSGEEVDVPVAQVGHDLDGLYAWIAGESRMVTGLRRHLVSELGMDRRQVAFMGYWRQGVAMKS